MVIVEFSPKQLVSHMKKAAAAVLVFAGLTMAAHCGTGCLPASSPSVEDDYTTAIIACAATAGYPGAYDHAADMRCRADVDCKFGLGCAS